VNDKNKDEVPGSSEDKSSEDNKEKEKNSESQEVTESLTEQKLIDYLKKDDDAAKILSEYLRAHQKSMVFIDIDARSGGSYFEGETWVSGDVVGRSQKKQASAQFAQISSETTANRVLSEDLRKAKSIYVPPPNYEEARCQLEDKNILILWGQNHWGKQTTALHLLSKLHNDVYEIDPAIEFDQLRSYEFGDDRGYFFNHISAKEHQIDIFLINQLSKKLKDRNSHLVIILESRFKLDEDALRSFLIKWSQLPDSEELLRKQLNWHLGDEKLLKEAELLVQEGEIQRILDTRLLPRDVERLSELIAHVVKGNLSLQNALDRFQVHTLDQVEKWFHEHPSVEDRTFMISVAVFNGGSEQTIFSAEEELRQLLSPRSKREDADEEQSLFGSMRSDRVKEVYAHPVDGYEETDFGLSPVRLIEFDNPNLQPAVLKLVWEEFERVRPLLLHWLHTMGTHPNFDVRASAAAAVGELCKYDFGYVKEEVLIRWANNNDPRQRMSAALALGIPIWEKEYAPLVLGLLHHWSTLRNNWRLSWTSAAAFGGLVGLRFPESALRDLFSIAEAADERLLRVLTNSMISLFRAGNLMADYYILVLDSLISWTSKGKNKIIMVTGLFVFLEIASAVRNKAESNSGWWPTVLWLAKENEIYEGKVINLFTGSLNNKISRKYAAEVLHQWLRMADDFDEDLYFDSIYQLFFQMISKGRERERERLLYFLENWAANPGEKSKSVARLVTEINKNLKEEVNYG
jgi:hypothetical protein